MENQLVQLARLGGATVIDYFRWTQLTPMILGWAITFGVILLMLLANHEDATFNAISTVGEWIAGLPWIGDHFKAWMASQADENSAITLSGAGAKAAVLKVWGVISLVLMLAWSVLGWLFGPFKPVTLKRQLKWTAFACLLVYGILLMMLFAARDQFNGPTLGWLLNFAALMFILFVVNAWCLSIAAALGLMRDLVINPEFKLERVSRDVHNYK